MPDLDLDPASLAHLASGGGFARRLAAAHPNTDITTLGLLARDPDPAVRKLIAQQPRCLSSVIGDLLFDDDEPVRRSAARHPAAPPHILDLLRRADAGEPITAEERNSLLAQSTWSRSLIARRPDTPSDTLTALANDPAPSIRAAIPRNPAAPSPILAALAADALPDTLRAIAAHLSTPPDTLASLARHPDLSVRATAAAHPRTPADALAALLEDGAADVRIAARDNPATPAEAIQTLVRAGSTPDLLAFGPCDPTLPPDILAAFASGGGGGSWARRLAARHPNTPSHLLHKLAADRDMLTAEIAERRLNQGPVSGMERPSTELGG